MRGVLAIGILASATAILGCAAGDPSPRRSTAGLVETDGHPSADDARPAGTRSRREERAAPREEAIAPAPRDAETVALAAGATFEGTDPRRLTIDTHLMVEEDVLIPARMSGIVEEIFVERGSHVRKDQLLLRLKNLDLKLRVKRAEIALKRAEADYARAQRLHAERTISESEYEAVQLDHEGVSVDLAIAREELERSMVRAPFTGLIIERFAKIGQKVIEDENPPLFRLTGLSPLHARLYLPEQVARALREGDEVDVVPRFDPAGRVKGRVTWISPVIDASSDTSLAIVSVPSGDGDASSLLPGAAVSVTLNVSIDGSGIEAPASSPARTPGLRQAGQAVGDGEAGGRPDGQGSEASGGGGAP